MAHAFEMDEFLAEIGECLNNDSGYTACLCSKVFNEREGLATRGGYTGLDDLKDKGVFGYQ